MHSAAIVAVAGLSLVAPGLAQTTADSKTFPDTTIAPAVGGAPPNEPMGDTEGPDISAPSAPESAPTSATTSQGDHHSRIHHTVPMKPVVYNGPVEAGQAMLRVKTGGWAYVLPATSARHAERLQVGKFVNVTGSTSHFFRVKLKSGATAYVPMSIVEVARPTDKIFRLTKNTAVLSAPNHASKRMAEVHDGHDVHVVGTSMNYLRIRMKDGLEGYIAMTALE